VPGAFGIGAVEGGREMKTNPAELRHIILFNAGSSIIAGENRLLAYGKGGESANVNGR